MMRLFARFLILLTASGLAAATVRGQFCGGPCEVWGRGADPVSPNPRYTLSEGVEKADWRYLFNWFWTEDGVQKHRVEATLKEPPCRDFGYRRMFVSPSGNGFLVTGNPYASFRGVRPQEPPLFVFCDPEGRRLAELPLKRVLSGKEARVGPCPGCGLGEILYVFAHDPSLSANGCFVELTVYNSGYWPVGFFLPLGCPVRRRAEFEAALEAAEWSRLSSPEVAKEKTSIEAFLRDLASDESAIRSSAANGLVARGYLALAATRKARDESKSGDFKARAKAVEDRLRPLGAAPWEAIPNDLGLLRSFLAYPDEDVVRVIQDRLAKILPPTKPMTPEACAAWIKEHQPKLRWNAEKGQYVE